MTHGSVLPQFYSSLRRLAASAGRRAAASCTAAKLYGCQVVRLPSCTAAKLYGCHLYSGSRVGAGPVTSAFLCAVHPRGMLAATFTPSRSEARDCSKVCGDTPHPAVAGLFYRAP